MGKVLTVPHPRKCNINSSCNVIIRSTKARKQKGGHWACMGKVLTVPYPVKYNMNTSSNAILRSTEAQRSTENQETWMHGGMVSMEAWKHGSTKAPKHTEAYRSNGSMEARKYGSMEAWIHGSTEARKHGSMEEAQKHRSMEAWKHGSTEARKHGSTEARTSSHPVWIAFLQESNIFIHKALFYCRTEQYIISILS